MIRIDIVVASLTWTSFKNRVHSFGSLCTSRTRLIMESLPDSSPLLPWELVEKIIGCSCDPGDCNYEVIRNFSLTCHQLRPRSLCFLVANASLSSRDKVFDFCDFLQDKSYLKPFVRSIAIHPKDFAPVPLLRILPNLSEIKFVNTTGRQAPMVLNQSSLKCCQRLSTHIHTLSLSHLYFATSIQFLHVLSAFTGIVHLACSSVLIEEQGDQTPLDVANRRLSPRLRLLTVSLPVSMCWDRDRNSSTHLFQLAIVYGRDCSPGHYLDQASVGALLLDSGMMRSTLENLTVEGGRFADSKKSVVIFKSSCHPTPSVQIV